MKVDELYDEHWLLAYEANVKGWLPSVGSSDHVREPAEFNFLKRNKVEFYIESNRLQRYPPGEGPVTSHVYVV